MTASENEVEYNLNRKTKVLIGSTDNNTVDFKIPDADFIAEVYGRRGSPFNILFPRVIIFDLLTDNNNVAVKKNQILFAANKVIKMSKKDKITVSQGAAFSFIFRLVKTQ